MVLEKSQAEELYKYAMDNKIILMEAIKTAYAPGFINLLSLAKSGVIGKIRDVEACFTKLESGDKRELRPEENGGSFTELASYPLLAIIKLLGTDYKSIRFDSFVDENGIDYIPRLIFNIIPG